MNNNINNIRNNKKNINNKNNQKNKKTNNNDWAAGSTLKSIADFLVPAFCACKLMGMAKLFEIRHLKGNKVACKAKIIQPYHILEEGLHVQNGCATHLHPLHTFGALS
eukprot:2128006-Amphidinium_carterae.1